MNPQPPYAQPPQPAQPPTAPPSKGRKFLIGFGVLFGLIVMGNALGDEDTSTPASSGTAQVAEADAGESTGSDAGESTGSDAEQVAQIGQEVRDGKFAFTVTDVRTGVESLGDGFLESTPQGSYVLVDVTVSNVGDEAQMFSDFSQKLIDAQGREFDADSGAAAMSLPESEAFLNNINPGNTVEGTLVFDVPEGLSPVAIELHDSAFSGGATVSLAG